jgi:hypothetical protein
MVTSLVVSAIYMASHLPTSLVSTPARTTQADCALIVRYFFFSIRGETPASASIDAYGLFIKLI